MELTRSKILDISAELFAERGFSGVSMRDIARSAGITQAAIYHHFSSKKELAFAVINEVIYPDLHRIWIAPQVPVSLSSSDYFAGMDPAMDAILEIIGQQVK